MPAIETKGTFYMENPETGEMTPLGISHIEVVTNLSSEPPDAQLQEMVGSINNDLSFSFTCEDDGFNPRMLLKIFYGADAGTLKWFLRYKGCLGMFNWLGLLWSQVRYEIWRQTRKIKRRLKSK